MTMLDDEPITEVDQAAEAAAAAEADGLGDRVATTNHVRVTLLDGTTWTVRIAQRDRIQYDLVGPRRKWPRAQEVPFLSSSFVAWVASKREQATALTWEQFSDVVADIVDLEDDTITGPTRKGPGLG